ncbi:DUF368 domain-containing protein [Oceanicoccus sp. KOV_DT_Chl]|uniref:DUF368 domain-containing protein n=1 Tax=Oceanicoccus sp. KOV_DT_Chl TaxID=1904639 RepID=UPI001F1C6F7F|nr:DUF368 domain-containing protein [Oceanicoccus sp. KOV_DT_Chl]
MSSAEKPSAFGVFIRGVAMGAADVVPGVSGGTVAFITGIYEQLLDAIKSINPTALMVLVKQGPKACWHYINGGFLLALLLGVFTSIVSLARVISYLLDHQPLLLWAFFFGLIAASSLHMGRQIKQWQPLTVGVLLLGGLIACFITEIKPSELTPSLLLYFLAGAIAICAMILPGISGSFILVLMGMYQHVLAAVKSFDWLTLMVFAAGCGIGLLSFAHFLSWLFRRFHDLTLALLTGFLIGSLNLVWPWKQTLSYYQNSKGESLALTQQNVLPWHYSELVGVPAQGVYCFMLMLVGLLLVILLEKWGDSLAAKA